MNLSQLRRMLFRTERGLGDYQAARRGPEVLGRRLVRRQVWRQIGRWTRWR